MIPLNVIEEIRKQADIVNIISTYINVIKKGNSYTAICPFHADKNPSLMISKSKQIYKCFSCGAGGNVFTFVQEYEKISFVEAVKKVASLIGFHDKSLEESARQVSDDVREILAALNDAASNFQYALKSQNGEKALEYLKNREIDQEMIDFFKLGYCFEGGINIKMLRAKNHRVDVLDRAGLLIREGAGNFIDRFQGRLMFPIFNEYNEVVGFSGRIIEKNGEAKYVNSINSPVFNKSYVLYNYQNAKTYAKREGAVYVVEGFMDVFALYRVGIKASVALMGTAFTEYHARLLKMLQVEVRILLDGDDAGRKGTLNMCSTLDKLKIPYAIVDYRDCLLDPDEILKQFGAENLKKFTTRLVNKYDFILQYYAKRIDLKSDEGRLDYVDKVTKYVADIEDPAKLEIFISKVSKLVDLNYQNILSRINKERDKQDRPNQNSVSFKKPTPKRITRLERSERLLIYNILNNVAALEYFQTQQGYFINDTYAVILNYVLDLYSEKKDYTMNDVLDYLNLKSNENLPYIQAIASLELEDYSNYDVEEFQEVLESHRLAIESKQAKEKVENIVNRADPQLAAKNLDELKKQQINSGGSKE